MYISFHIHMSTGETRRVREDACDFCSGLSGIVPFHIGRTWKTFDQSRSVLQLEQSYLRQLTVCFFLSPCLFAHIWRRHPVCDVQFQVFPAVRKDAVDRLCRHMVIRDVSAQCRVLFGDVLGQYNWYSWPHQERVSPLNCSPKDQRSRLCNWDQGEDILAFSYEGLQQLVSCWICQTEFVQVWMVYMQNICKEIPPLNTWQEWNRRATVRHEHKCMKWRLTKKFIFIFFNFYYFLILYFFLFYI